MVGNYDYNNEEVMNILNNSIYTDEQKKQLFEKYKSDLKDKRRREIINRLNECAKNNPIVTQEEYINFLKQYNDDNLTKPFEVIEKELEIFSRKMQEKYDAYIKAKQEAEIKNSSIEKEVVVEDNNSDLDISDEIKPDVTPVSYNTNNLSDTIFQNPIISNESVEEDNLEPTVFESQEVKEKLPEEIPDSLNEKGNASAIIISIIAIIIGMVIMYSIIKLK